MGLGGKARGDLVLRVWAGSLQGFGGVREGQAAQLKTLREWSSAILARALRAEEWSSVERAGIVSSARELRSKARSL